MIELLLFTAECDGTGEPNIEPQVRWPTMVGVFLLCLPLLYLYLRFWTQTVFEV